MDKIIGVVGGMGPLAGIELVKNIFSFTKANNDQEHIPLIHVSLPDQITDRTSYLLGKSTLNPAFKLARIILRLEKLGATIIGLACNTCHAPEIYNVILSELKKSKSEVLLVNMIHETIKYLNQLTIRPGSIGVISTNGTYYTNLYHDALSVQGYNVIVPESDFQQSVIHRSIYDPIFGLKAKSNPISFEAKVLLKKTFNYFKERGADTVILGCTEISFAADYISYEDLILVDPLKILSKSLIGFANPKKLIGDPTLEMASVNIN